MTFSWKSFYEGVYISRFDIYYSNSCLIRQSALQCNGYIAKSSAGGTQVSNIGKLTYFLMIYIRTSGLPDKMSGYCFF